MRHWDVVVTDFAEAAPEFFQSLDEFLVLAHVPPLAM
jgi:hypothetical protein